MSLLRVFLFRVIITQRTCMYTFINTHLFVSRGSYQLLIEYTRLSIVSLYLPFHIWYIYSVLNRSNTWTFSKLQRSPDIHEFVWRSWASILGPYLASPLTHISYTCAARDTLMLRSILSLAFSTIPDQSID